MLVIFLLQCFFSCLPKQYTWPAQLHKHYSRFTVTKSKWCHLLWRKQMYTEAVHVGGLNFTAERWNGLLTYRLSAFLPFFSTSKDEKKDRKSTLKLIMRNLTFILLIIRLLLLCHSLLSVLMNTLAITYIAYNCRCCINIFYTVYHILV